MEIRLFVRLFVCTDVILSHMFLLFIFSFCRLGATCRNTEQIGDAMSTTQELLGEIISTFRLSRVAQVPGYSSFGYVRGTDNAVFVSREGGKDTRIPHEKILSAIEAVKADPSVYDGGPSTLRRHGITHITSPLWSLLHMLPRDRYRGL